MGCLVSGKVVRVVTRSGKVVSFHGQGSEEHSQGGVTIMVRVARVATRSGKVLRDGPGRSVTRSGKVVGI